MKRFASFILITIVIFGCMSKSKLEEIQQAIDNKNLSEAKNLFEKYQYRFRKVDYLYFDGIIRNGVSENEKSILSFQKLLNECSDQLSDSLTIVILQFQLDNYQKISLFDKALEIRNLLQSKYAIKSDSLVIQKSTKYE